MELLHTSCNFETLTLISPPSQSCKFGSSSLFFYPRRVTLYSGYHHSGRFAVSASFQHGDLNPSSNSLQTNHEDHASLAQNSISGFLRQEIGLSEVDSDFISSNCPKYTRMIVEGVRDLEEWNSWKGSGESEGIEGLGFKEKVIYMVKQKGDGGKVAFLESLGLSLSSAMYLAHYVSSESLPILLDKVIHRLFDFAAFDLNCSTDTYTLGEKSFWFFIKSELLVLYDSVRLGLAWYLILDLDYRLST